MPGIEDLLRPHEDGLERQNHDLMTVVGSLQAQLADEKTQHAAVLSQLALANAAVGAANAKVAAFAAWVKSAPAA